MYIAFMRILLVNHYAGHPRLGMEYRPFYMAKEWQELGHDVEIVACSQSHVRQHQPKCHGWKTHERIDGINYTWLKSTAYSGNGVARLLNMLFFVIRFWLYGRFFIQNRPDVIIASSTYPLDVYPSHLLAKRWRAQFIFEIHDLWPLSPIELGGISPKHPLMRLFQHAEDYGYKHCDAVVSMLPCTLEHMKNHGLNPKKFNYIPNGIIPEDWQENHPLPELHKSKIQELKDKNHFLVAYAGAHGTANDLISLVEAAKSIDKNIDILLVGQGPEKRHLIDHAKSLNLTNVHFLPAIRKTEIPAFLAHMDALYIGLSPQPLFRFGVSPNKLMDYMMASKPIIYAIASGNHPVVDFRCGIETSPGKPQQIGASINKIYQLDEKQLLAMGQNGRKAVRESFNYSVLAKNFEKIMLAELSQRDE